MMDEIYITKSDGNGGKYAQPFFSISFWSREVQQCLQTLFMLWSSRFLFMRLQDQQLMQQFFPLLVQWEGY